MLALFTTSLSKVLHCQSILWWIILLVLSVFPKNYEIRKEEGITVLIEVTVMEGYLLEGDYSR